MKFQYLADKKYFANLFCGGNLKKFNEFALFFDFRNPKIKRQEFNAKRNKLFEILLKKYGKHCLLNLNDKCTCNRNLVVDHFIPLSSNKLNKELRKLKPKKGKKIQTQSFGSNNLCNLILACENCNSFKKHKIPTKTMWLNIKNLKH